MSPFSPGTAATQASVPVAAAGPALAAVWTTAPKAMTAMAQDRMRRVFIGWILLQGRELVFPTYGRDVPTARDLPRPYRKLRPAWPSHMAVRPATLQPAPALPLGGRFAYPKEARAP